MEEIQRFVTIATTPDTDVEQKHQAFGEIVKRFQDMAFASAYAVLGDFQLAQDAAQEAFLSAYRNLNKLKNPGAFAGSIDARKMFADKTTGNRLGCSVR